MEVASARITFLELPCTCPLPCHGAAQGRKAQHGLLQLLPKLDFLGGELPGFLCSVELVYNSPGGGQP
jgi:hypothetical protein